MSGSFPVISGGQTNFLVSFLTGFNYTRMIFRVKDISKKVQTVQFFRYLCSLEYNFLTDQPFTAPAVIPAITHFCAKMYTRITGRETSTTSAHTRFQLLLNCP